MDSKSNWAEHFTPEDLAVLCDFQSKRIDALIHDAMFFEEEIRGIFDAARRAFPLRHTDNGAGLRQLIHAIRQTKERCEARALEAQLKRSAESMREIESFRAAPEQSKLGRATKE